MHLYENISIRISEYFIQSFMFIFNNVIKILTELQNFVRLYYSLKCRNSYRKLIFHRSCFECIEIIRIWFFWCTVTWISLTLWYKKNLLSMLLWLQIPIDPYLKTVTVPTNEQKSLLHPIKIKFSPVPVVGLAWNFVECYFGPLVNVRIRTGINTTLK